MENNTFSWKTIGILGGMGPETTAEFYRRLVRIFQKNYGAKYDSDFPPILIYNMPLPDIVEDSGNRMSVIEFIKNGINKLENAGCSFIAVPCNTVFYFIDLISSNIPLINIVEETFAEVKRRKIGKIGLLSTKNTSKTLLYEKVFESIEIIKPSTEEQKKVNEIILRILSGDKLDEDKKFIRKLCEKLTKRSAEAVILGCTELSLLISQADCNIQILDTLDILAESTVKKSENGCDGVIGNTSGCGPVIPRSNRGRGPDLKRSEKYG